MIYVTKVKKGGGGGVDLNLGQFKEKYSFMLHTAANNELKIDAKSVLEKHLYQGKCSSSILCFKCPLNPSARAVFSP